MELRASCGSGPPSRALTVPNVRLNRCIPGHSRALSLSTNVPRWAHFPSWTRGFDSRHRLQPTPKPQVRDSLPACGFRALGPSIPPRPHYVSGARSSAFVPVCARPCFDPRMHKVVLGALVREGRVLLVHRSPNKRAYPDVWDLPGGLIEAGESELGALTRELTKRSACR